MKTCSSWKIWSLESEQESLQNMRKISTKNIPICAITKDTLIWHTTSINTSTWTHTIHRSSTILTKITRIPINTKITTLTFTNNHIHPHTSIVNKRTILSKKSERKQAIKKVRSFVNWRVSFFKWAFLIRWMKLILFRQHSIYKVNTFFFILRTNNNKSQSFFFYQNLFICYFLINKNS